MPEERIKRGCWTCKSRKIRCDQGSPVCQTCVVAKKKCLGYGLRLSWPREGDRRRAIVPSQTTPQHDIMQLSTCRTRFINTTFWDITLHDEMVNDGTFQQHMSSWRQPSIIPRPMSTTWGSLEDRDQILLSYYEAIASRLIATVDDDTNGFRHVLIKMALSDLNESSSAILQGILTFSAYHLHGIHAASAHNVAAVQALSKSLKTAFAPQDRLCQLAASMLLVTCGVFNVDKSAWTTHFCGAKTLARVICAEPKSYEREDAFGYLTNWVYAYNVLSTFSLCFWPQKSLAQRRCEEDPLLLGPSTQTNIVGHMGCSIELMSIIARLNANVQTNDSSMVEDQSETVNQLEQQLLSLRQYLTLRGLQGSPLDEAAVLNTAELYRFAALIYLERACWKKSRESVEVTRLVDDAFNILDKLQVCTAPWPLFIVGCEAETDSRRSMTIQLFEKSAEYRKADNILWIRRLVEGIWKQDDLSTYSHMPKSVMPLLRYGSVMSASSHLPSFW